MKLNANLMKTTLAGVFAFLVAASVQAQTAKFEAQATGSKVKIEGTSSIHDWDVNSTIIGGFMEVDPAALDKAAPGPVKANVQVTIPVRTLKSYQTSMDEVMQEHLKFKDFKTITYKMSELTVKEVKDKTITCESKGDLTVAGKTNAVSFPVTITRPDANSIKIVSGKIPLKMTAFNVQPPAPKIGLGLITTGDDITITFEWLAAKAEK
jgi:polyisoprenoid-binding protein YceI